MIFIVCNKMDAMMHAHYMWFELHNCHSSLHATINVREKEKKREKVRSHTISTALRQSFSRKQRKRILKEIITLIIKGAHSNRISTNQTMIIIILINTYFTKIIKADNSNMTQDI